MMKISESIIKLLIQDDEVTITGFGVFKAEMINASIHPITKEVTPPNKKLTFVHNQNVFSTRFERVFASENNLSTDEAIRNLSDIVKQFNSDLQSMRKVEIAGFATLKMNVDDSFDVITDENIVFDKDFFALPSFQLKSNQNTEIVDESKNIQLPSEEPKPISPIVESIAETPENTTIINPPTIDKSSADIPKPKKKKSWLWLLILILLIGGLGVVGFVFKDKVIELYNRNFSKVEVKVEKKDTVITETVEIVKEVTDTTIQENVDTTTKVEITPEVVKPVKTNNGSGSNYVKPVDLSKIVYAPKGAGKYYVIAGSFKIIENAATLVAQLKKKGFDPVVIEKNEQGLIRVAYKPGFDTERLARDFADDLYENKNLLPWIVQF